jgi:hypothetical protein
MMPIIGAKLIQMAEFGTFHGGSSVSIITNLVSLTFKEWHAS